MDLELIHLWRRNDRIPTGDRHGVDMSINVSFDRQLSRLLIDDTKVTRLFEKGTVKNALTGQEMMAMLTRICLGGSQLGHFAAASLIRSTYLRCAFFLERKRNIVRIVCDAEGRGRGRWLFECCPSYMVGVYSFAQDLVNLSSVTLQHRSWLITGAILRQSGEEPTRAVARDPT